MSIYVIILVISWVSWKLFCFLREWRTKHRCVAGLPVVDGSHWFLGLAFQVNNLNDFWNITLRFVERTSPRWFVYRIFVPFPHICAVHPDCVQAVLTANDVPKNEGLAGAYRMIRPFIGDSIFLSQGAKYTRNRRLMTSAFHFDILKPYVDIFNDVADTLMEKMSCLSKAGSSIDIYPLVDRATLHALLRCSFGDDSIHDAGKTHRFVNSMSQMKTHFVRRLANPILFFDFIYNHTPNGRDFKRVCDDIHEISADIISRRRVAIEHDPSQLDKRHLDFLDVLITARDAEGAGFTDKEIQNEVETFMAAGYDTTGSAISWATYFLAKYPDMRQNIRNEVSVVLDGRQRLRADDLGKLIYTTCFIKEVMRMYTPVPGISRKLNKPCTIDGIVLPEGQVIDILPHAVHHHPDVWDNHWEFRPERFLPENMTNRHPYAFIPFSAGQRSCIGQHFAMNEIKVMVCRIAERFDLMIDPNIEAVPYMDFIMGAKNGIHLFLTDRM